MKLKLQPNILIKQRELKPVTSHGKAFYNDGKLPRLLKSINRYSIKERMIICAAVSPDKSKGIFLDDKGHEYLISSDDLNSDLKYISSKFVKKKEKKFVGTRYASQKYNLIVKNFLKRPDVKKRFFDWEGISPSVMISEEEDMYEVGKCYLADDGDWSFKVLSKNNDYIQIQDLTDKKKYKVELSDLELTNPSEITEESDDEDVLKSNKKDLARQYDKLKEIESKWKRAKEEAFRYADANGIKFRSGRISGDPDKVKEYRSLRAEADRYMYRHSKLTSKFKTLYKSYIDLGGEKNKDWYIASTEWDDAD